MSYERDMIANAIHNYMATIKPLSNGTVRLDSLQSMSQCLALTDVVLAGLQRHGLYVVGAGAIAPSAD